MLERQVTNIVNRWFGNKISQDQMFDEIESLYDFWRKNRVNTEHKVELKVKKVLQRASIPSYSTKGSACFDIRGYIDDPDLDTEELPSSVDVALVSDQQAVIVRTGLAFEVPKGFVLLLFARSGLAFKNQVQLGNSVGVIDSDYRGEVKVCLTKATAGSYTISDGDRIAQGMLLPIPQASLVEVNKLSTTERGEGGFGSTGIS